MKLTLKTVAHHRNGICGAPFYAVTFRDDGERREAINERRRQRRLTGCLCGYPDWPEAFAKARAYAMEWAAKQNGGDAEYASWVQGED